MSADLALVGPLITLFSAPKAPHRLSPVTAAE
jgi:hypothetical protein